MGRFRILLGEAIAVLLVFAMLTTAYPEKGEKKIPVEASEDADEAGSDSSATDSLDQSTGVVDGNSAAGFSIISAIPREQQPSVVLSPLSIERVLRMLQAGARAETLSQLDDLIGPADHNHPVKAEPERNSQEDEAEANSGDTAAETAPAQLGSDPAEAVSHEDLVEEALAMWIADNYPVKADFSDAVERRLGASLFNAAFESKAAEELERTNRWIEESTNGRIQSLLADDDITSLTRLVLTSAIAFEGSWRDPFDPKFTSDREFLTFSADTTQQLMMERVGEIAAAQVLLSSSQSGDRIVRIISLPLEGAGECLFLMPDRVGPGEGGKPDAVRLSRSSLQINSDFDALEQALVESKLQGWREKLGRHALHLQLPKLVLGGRPDMQAALERLGVDLIFSQEAADLSGISDEAGLAVSALRHEARIEIDEQGARGEAATAAAVAGRGFGKLPVKWSFDQPFVFVMVDDSQTVPIFIGRFGGYSDGVEY